MWLARPCPQPPPSPRSGHSATLVGGKHLVIFGGLHTKHFIGDTVVLDVAAERWFRPPSSAVGGPGPRAFHCALAMGKDLYVMCGRTGRQQHGDTWVLDTQTWEWRELRPPTSGGGGPGAPFPGVPLGTIAPRDFGAAARVDETHIVLFGGYDGQRWLNDTNVLDIATGAWRALPLANGVAPGPRSGHAMAVVERRLLVFGGQASNGQLCGDLWALRGVVGGAGGQSEGGAGADRQSSSSGSGGSANGGEDGTPRWTRLQLRGAGPSARAGHCVTAAGPFVVIFGGHGDDGWLVKQQVYYDDVHCIDRETGRWRRLAPAAAVAPPAGGAVSPAPRAFHTMTRVGDRLLLFGGFTGAEALNDTWWLHLDDDEVVTGTVESAHGGRGGGVASGATPSPASRSVAGNAPTGGRAGGGLGLFSAVAGTSPGRIGEFLLAGLGGVGGVTGGATPGTDRGTAGGVGALARSLGGLGLGSNASAGEGAGAGAGGVRPSPVPGPEASSHAILAGVLTSLERRLSGDEAFAELGEEGMRQYLASCDPEDLRLGEMERVMTEYRRAVLVQGLGIPGDGRGGDGGDGGDVDRGRFIHVSPGSLRMSDVPSMLAEMQGALIAMAPAEESA